MGPAPGICTHVTLPSPAGHTSASGPPPELSDAHLAGSVITESGCLLCRLLAAKRCEEHGKLAENLGQHQMIVVAT